MGDIWKTCIICGRHNAALRLHQQTDVTLTTDGGTEWQFAAYALHLNLWYHCATDVADEDRPDGCGALYSVPYSLTDDQQEADVAAGVCG